AIGSVCALHYEYFLSFDAEDMASEEPYIVYCELWGLNAVREKALSEEKFDAHEFMAKHSMDLARSFAIPCSLLNEKLGEDHLFIKLYLVHNRHLLDQIKSEIVSDRF
ncbi:MAG: hypothetical protein R3240_11395, partial [Gammaproteobacteria bacterium]|nr:hypothetical protein [Gammaproteobacteria bacterium]